MTATLCSLTREEQNSACGSLLQPCVFACMCCLNLDYTSAENTFGRKTAGTSWERDLERNTNRPEIAINDSSRGGSEEEAEWRREKEVIKRNPKTRIWHHANDHSEKRGETYANEISKKRKKKCRHKYHRRGFLTGIIPHFEKCHLWGASLWIILIEDIQLCGWVCSQTEGGVGIVCHQMNSWGETNEECREKEGGILIGPSLFSLCLPL